VSNGSGKVLLNCHGGCSAESVAHALGLELRDLFDEPLKRPRIVKAYVYTDEAGQPIFEVRRWEPKDFRQARIEPGGRRVSEPGCMKGVRLVPYRLPELRLAVAADDAVYIVEGEKDADAVHARGLVATCNPGGTAGGWSDDNSEHFRGAVDVRIIADRDAPGYQHAIHVRESLRRVGVEARVFEAASGKDASDHFAAGHTLEELVFIDPEERLERLRAKTAATTEAKPAPVSVEQLLVSAHEFENDPAPVALVEGLIFEASTHTLTGASKAGKSYLVLQLCASIAHGEPFLDLAVVQVPVLLLSLELAAGMVRDRLRWIAHDVGLPEVQIGEHFQLVAPTLDRVRALELATDAGAEVIEKLIAHTGARVVVFDTLYRFLPGVDPNSNAEMGAVFGRLNTLAQRSGAALVLLDHVAKGEQLGPVSHSALGASVKGGASRAVIGLRRTSKEDGGRWELNVESHFGSWDEPIHYQRPTLPSGDRGRGCVRCGAAEAWGLGLDTLEDFFRRFAEHDPKDPMSRPTFASKTKLREALIQAGHATGNSTADSIVAALVREHCVPKGSAWRVDSRPIVTSEGPRSAVVFEWRGTAQ
jgi:hypothetical protein